MGYMRVTELPTRWRSDGTHTKAYFAGVATQHEAPDLVACAVTLGTANGRGRLWGLRRGGAHTGVVLPPKHAQHADCGEQIRQSRPQARGLARVTVPAVPHRLPEPHGHHRHPRRPDRLCD